MKRSSLIILTAIITVMALSSFTYKKTIIPLGNDKGIPFFKDQMDYYVDGFDIDKDGKFYILGGLPATLVCFNNNILQFHKKYTEFHSGQLYIYNDKLYLFDAKYRKSNIFVLNKTDGTIEKECKNISNNGINSFLFRDSSLIVEVFDDNINLNKQLPLSYMVFDLNGKYLKHTNNIYNVPAIVNPSKKSMQYLGLWMNNFIYWDYDVDRKQYIFILKNEYGKIISSKSIDEKVFGKSFYGNPIEHKKIRNGNIYILTHDYKNAIITEISINDLFSAN